MKNIFFSCVFLFTLFGSVELQITGGSTSRTTYTPRQVTCYQCSNCPLPFTSSSYNVRTYLSLNGWCAKMSSSNDRNAPATRGVDPGVCAYYGYAGCTWRDVNGVNTYVCCCRGSYCNAANSISKWNFTILSFSLLILFISNIF